MCSALPTFKISLSKHSTKNKTFPKIPHLDGNVMDRIFRISTELVSTFAAGDEPLQELWIKWGEILTLSKSTTPNIPQLRKTVTKWSLLFLKVYGHDNVTPYIHIICSHWADLMDLHGNLTEFSQEGFEGAHHFQKLIYSRVTSKGGGKKTPKSKSVHYQILEKHYRSLVMEVMNKVDMHRNNIRPEFKMKT